MKSNLDKMFKANKDAEANGVEFVVEVDAEGKAKTAFQVRRFVETNPKIKAAMTRYYKPYARMIEAGTMDPEKDREIMTKIFVDSCIVGWKGVIIDEKEVEFSKEKAVELLLALPDLFRTLYEHAQKLENYREDLGNS